MNKVICSILFFVGLNIYLVACVTLKPKLPILIEPIRELKLLDIYEIPYNLSYKSTIVGGLSGIDFDEKKNQYYFISDDGSKINPARFYTANIQINQQGIDTVIFNETQVLKNELNQSYPSFEQNPSKSVDPEGIRYNPKKNYLVWCSEGEKVVTNNDTLLSNPAINWINQQGNLLGNFILPLNLYMQGTEKGPRKNEVLEGLAFFKKYKKLMVNIEEPLYEDGPRASLIPNKAFIRFFEFNVRNKKNTAQYAYELDPIAYPPLPIDGFCINGVPDILYLGNEKWLVLERSYSTGRIPCTIKIFLADFSNASNISTIDSLKNNNEFIPVKKQLLLNMDTLGVLTDNIEGVCWGPKLANGHASLLLLSDNNFSSKQKSQLFLLEINP